MLCGAGPACDAGDTAQEAPDSRVCIGEYCRAGVGIAGDSYTSYLFKLRIGFYQIVRFQSVCSRFKGEKKLFRLWGSRYSNRPAWTHNFNANIGFENMHRVP